MSLNSRSYAGAALLAASMSIPAMAHAQVGVAERSLMNRVGLEPRSQTSVHQPGSAPGSGYESQASRALQGTVVAIRFAGSETAMADSGVPTAEQALLGQAPRPKTRKEN